MSGNKYSIDSSSGSCEINELLVTARVSLRCALQVLSHPTVPGKDSTRAFLVPGRCRTKQDLLLELKDRRVQKLNRFGLHAKDVWVNGTHGTDQTSHADTHDSLGLNP